MKVIEHFLNLTHVLLLHLSSCDALFAIGLWIREQDLVDNNVSNVDILFGQFNGKSLGLIHAQELRDANCHEGGSLWVLELTVDFLSFLLHAVHGLEEFLVYNVWVHTCLSLSLHHAVHGSEHATEFLLQLDQLHDGLFKDVWQVQKSQGVSSWSSIENDQLEVVLVKTLQHLTKRCGLVDTGNAIFNLVHKTLALVLHLIGHSFHMAGFTTAETKAIHEGAASAGFWINFHGKKILKAIDLCWLSAELLIKCITEVMCGISRDDQNILPVLAHLHGQTAGCGSFTNTTFSTHEDPLE